MDTETPTTENANTDEPWLKELRRKAGAYDTAFPKLQKDFALIKAGVDTDQAQAELFVKGWDGDWADVDAVKTAAEKYGLVKQEASVETPQNTSVEDHAAMQRIQNAGSDVTEVTPSGDDSWKSAKTLDEFLSGYQAAGGEVVGA